MGTGCWKGGARLVWSFWDNPYGFWRNHSIDFNDLTWYDFVKYETVESQPILLGVVTGALSPFVVSSAFINQLSLSIFNYCFGKQISLKDSTRWLNNYHGEIIAFLLERGRYLQAYSRDVNTDIDDNGSETTVSTGQSVTGKSDTRKKGSAENNQISNVGGANSQSVDLQLGDTLTVLNNQSTSTRYLANSNEESYSRGDNNETTNSNFGKSDSTTVNLSLDNGDSLEDNKNTNTTNKIAKKSPLDIALTESNFNFQEFFQDLYHILDSYFIVGGQEDYA